MLFDSMDCLCGLPLRSSDMSVVFNFNATLNDSAPVSPIPFPVQFRFKVICKTWNLGTLPCLQLISSRVSAVLAFNDSLSDVAPEFLVSLAIMALQ